METSLAQEIVEVRNEIDVLERLPYEPERDEWLRHLQRRLAGLVSQAQYQDVLEHAQKIVEAL